ncbi:MAG TPA: lysozyme inhibitor LprI family protein [Sphingomicrobium sp.]|nr:lysozyme inhibitor LprI family protein [Sphingomicrobium sp.]
MRRFSLTLAAIATLFAAGACGKKRPADALDENAILANTAEPAPVAQPQKLCASSAIYDKIKLELFREAAEIRGRDQETLGRIAAYSALRVDEPVLRASDDAVHSVTCTAHLALDLPPGLAVAGGRRSLDATLGYTVQSAGDGNVVTLSGADAITVPLATLAKVAPPPVSAPIAPLPSDPLAPIPESAAPSAPVSQPSFDCAKARTRGEQAVCASTGLAALDRAMATYYNRVMASADDGTAAELRRTRDRFIAYRERCTTDTCIADAYRGRMREIGEIAAGR